MRQHNSIPRAARLLRRRWGANAPPRGETSAGYPSGHPPGALAPPGRHSPRRPGLYPM